MRLFPTQRYQDPTYLLKFERYHRMQRFLANQKIIEELVAEYKELKPQVSVIEHAFGVVKFTLEDGSWWTVDISAFNDRDVLDVFGNIHPAQVQQSLDWLAVQKQLIAAGGIDYVFVELTGALPANHSTEST